MNKILRRLVPFQSILFPLSRTSSGIRTPQLVEVRETKIFKTVLALIMVPLIFIISQAKVDAQPKDTLPRKKVRSYKYYKIIEGRNIFKPWSTSGPTDSTLPESRKAINTCGVTYNNKLKQYELIIEDPKDPKEGKTSLVKVGNSILGKKILKIELDHVILLSKTGQEEKILIGDPIIEEEEEEEEEKEEKEREKEKGDKG